MVENHCENPCNDKLEAGERDSDTCLSHFSVDRSDRCHTWNIEKTENHHCVGVGCAKSHGSKDRYHAVHTCGSRNIGDAKKNAAAGNNDFFCSNTGDQSNGDLPVPKSRRSK